MTGPGTEFSFPFSLDEDGGASGVSTTKESSWLFVEWFVVKKNGMIFSKDVRQLLLVVYKVVVVVCVYTTSLIASFIQTPLTA